LILKGKRGKLDGIGVNENEIGSDRMCGGYTISVVDVELSIYGDRLEIISPGRLPNTVTVEKIKSGYRASRNELIKEVLRDYRYIEAPGLGVPRKIIKGMRKHNDTEPDLIEEEDRFIVRLWK